MKTNTSKLLLSLVCLTLMIGSKSSAQTNVSGGIFANTVWTKANSPYIVTGDVAVLSGVTLTIQPGVMVKFDNSTFMRVTGKLYALGTSSDSIIFTSNAAKPFPGIYGGILTTNPPDTQFYRYCGFYYADTALFEPKSPIISHCSFISNYIGTYSGYGVNKYIDSCDFIYDSIGIREGGCSNAMRSCRFLHNSTGTLVTGMRDSNCIFKYNRYAVNTITNKAIINCIIDSNGVGISGLNDTITNSEIKYNGIGIADSYFYWNNLIKLNDISDNKIGIQTYDDFISCNTICNNTQYNIQAEMPNNELASDNYWCLPDSAHIQATIYDGYQDVSLGLVFFTPFDTAACANVPTKVNEVPASSGAINVYPNPGSGVFTIQGLGVSCQLSVEVYNVLGEKVYSAPTAFPKRGSVSSSYEINFSSQPSGIYFYRVVAEDGAQIGMGKVVIQK